MNSSVVVFVTVPSQEVAEELGHAVVEEQLVACVNILPAVTSIYRWEGKIAQDDELLMIMKTQTSLVEALTVRVQELHPYDLPEVIALPITGGSESYMKWIKDATSEKSGDSRREP